MSRPRSGMRSLAWSPRRRSRLLPATARHLAHIFHRLAKDSWGVPVPVVPFAGFPSHPLRLARPVCAAPDQAGERNARNFRYLCRPWGQRSSHLKHGTQISRGGRHGRILDHTRRLHQTRGSYRRKQRGGRGGRCSWLSQTSCMPRTRTTRRASDGDLSLERPFASFLPELGVLLHWRSRASRVAAWTGTSGPLGCYTPRQTVPLQVVTPLQGWLDSRNAVGR